GMKGSRHRAEHHRGVLQIWAGQLDVWADLLEVLHEHSRDWIRNVDANLKGMDGALQFLSGLVRKTESVVSEFDGLLFRAHSRIEKGLNLDRESAKFVNAGAAGIFLSDSTFINGKTSFTKYEPF